MRAGNFPQHLAQFRARAWRTRRARQARAACRAVYSCIAAQLPLAREKDAAKPRMTCGVAMPAQSVAATCLTLQDRAPALSRGRITRPAAACHETPWVGQRRTGLPRCYAPGRRSPQRSRAGSPCGSIRARGARVATVLTLPPCLQEGGRHAGALQTTPPARLRAANNAYSYRVSAFTYGPAPSKRIHSCPACLAHANAARRSGGVSSQSSCSSPAYMNQPSRYTATTVHGQSCCTRSSSRRVEIERWPDETTGTVRISIVRTSVNGANDGHRFGVREGKFAQEGILFDQVILLGAIGEHVERKEREDDARRVSAHIA